MSLFHLIWICPLCGFIGKVVTALCVTAKRADDDQNNRQSKGKG